ncbi:AraC family transcriptional regulator [Pedobacter punctiformis]|uniref:AraC family transcriptional regulator n=1 Tax=Pedobacter punctiformis TaxID=3004097 RepID=A0ABT4LAY8_9SPHI|nr:AraC family transcriptional regulator [Pedobacter sp. HCMS5-2]MCZ4245091.1 AraC family transcriptional regulator [Pedobacter sp. HCMS5-2]
MKAINFVLQSASDNSIIVQEDLLPKFYNYLHYHKEYQITLIIKGEGNVIVGNYNQSFKAGDIYFIGPNQPHIFNSVNAESDGIHAVHLFFDLDKLTNLLNLPEMEGVKKIIESSLKGLQVPAKQRFLISEYILNIKKSDGLDRLINLIKIFQYCEKNIKDFKSLSTGFVKHNIPETENFRLNEVHQYTLEHYCEDISLEKVASIACITLHAFCKFYKKHTRKTYYTFLNEVRINEACKKIINSDFEHLSDIAYATGFNSIITFNRVFKKITAMSPRDYLRLYRFKQSPYHLPKVG